MSIINIIIIVILLLLIIWAIRRIFFTTNIIYDLMCNANEPPTSATDSQQESFLITNKNVIKNSLLNETNSSNFMLSVWYYVDHWETGTNDKNILYLSHSPLAQTQPDLLNTFSGLSTKKQSTGSTAGGTPYKNLALSLDGYQNNLYIDIETYAAGVDNEYFYTRYVIKNMPLQKWNFVTVSVDGRTLDIYLDGKLRNSFILNGIYRSVNGSNLKNIYLGNMNATNPGFNGFITRVRYEGEATNPQLAYNMYREGINGTLASSIFNKYGLKVTFLEYNKVKSEWSI